MFDQWKGYKRGQQYDSAMTDDKNQFGQSFNNKDWG